MRDLRVSRENPSMYRVRRKLPLLTPPPLVLGLVLLDVEATSSSLTLWRWLEHVRQWAHYGPIMDRQLHLLFHPSVPLNVFFGALYEYPKLPEECRDLIDRIDWAEDFDSVDSRGGVAGRD